MNMSVSREQVGDVVVLNVVGEVDIHTVPGLAAGVAEILQESTGSVVIDLTDVSFIDSSGLGELVRAHRELADRGRQMRLACSRPTLLRLFDITGVDELFTVLPTREAAVAAVGG